MSGPNNLQACTLDTDCRFCMGGSHNGLACTTTTPTCLDEGTCNLGTHQCVGGTRNGLACTVEADCPDNSGVCRGHCVNRASGGDNCEDAYVHVITVPTLSEGPKTVTISGNNLPATSTEEEPDSCFGPIGGANGEPGWFEAFWIDECARVRIDLCCSDPLHNPAYDFLYRDCQCGDPIHAVPDPRVLGGGTGFRVWATVLSRRQFLGDFPVASSGAILLPDQLRARRRSWSLPDAHHHRGLPHGRLLLP
jgi:hypothetical protein